MPLVSIFCGLLLTAAVVFIVKQSGLKIIVRRMKNHSNLSGEVRFLDSCLASRF